MVEKEETLDRIRELLARNGDDPATVLAALTDKPTTALTGDHQEEADKPPAEAGGPLECDPGAADAKAEGEPRLATALVEFHGHDIEVQTPTPDQLMIIRRIQQSLDRAANQPEIDGRRAAGLMNRIMDVVCSLIVFEDDAEYLEDLILSGQATLEETIPLVRKSVEALNLANGGGGRENREERRRLRRSGDSGGTSLVTSG